LTIKGLSRAYHVTLNKSPSTFYLLHLLQKTHCPRNVENQFSQIPFCFSLE
jgi:hypothetical protein